MCLEVANGEGAADRLDDMRRHLHGIKRFVRGSGEDSQFVAAQQCYQYLGREYNMFLGREVRKPRFLGNVLRMIDCKYRQEFARKNSVNLA